MVSLCNEITKDEMRMIDNAIYGCADGHGGRASVPYVLRLWDANKQGFLYDLLGKKLSVSKEIEIDRDKQVEEEFKQLLPLNNTLSRFANNLLDLIDDNDCMLRAVVESCFEPKALANNSYTGGKYTIPLGEKSFRTESGMKVMKILAKVADFYNIKEQFEEFRQFHSMVTNTKMFKGKLTLSIHPLDYITMSDNGSDWSSCMSWTEGGCYRQGTVEMMNSECVLVAFLESEDQFRIHGGIWNNKKWRTLVVCNSDLIASIKAYPYQSDTLTTEVMDFIKELAQENLHINFKENLSYEYGPYSNINLEQYGANPIRLCFYTNNMYNDFGCVDYHFVSLSEDYINKIKDKHITRDEINYSGETECMWCGAVCEVVETGDLVCEDCNGYITCDHCGDRTDYDELSEVDGEMICDYCRENETFNDPIDEDIHLLDNSVRVYVVNNPEVLKYRYHTRVPYFQAYNENVSGDTVLYDNDYWNNDCQIKAYRRENSYVTLYYIDFNTVKEDIVSILFDGPHDYDALVEQIEKNDNFVLGLEQ